jgi:hypothetical protein
MMADAAQYAGARVGALADCASATFELPQARISAAAQ